MWAVYIVQGLLVTAVCGLIIERVRVLLYNAPASDRFLAVLERACRARSRERALALASELSEAWAARVVRAGLAGGDEALAEMEEELLEIRAKAVKRLRALRICATLSSTLGLLGAIAALVRGFGGGGLLALQSGLAQRVAVGQALLMMGIGVATSAVCFYAFGLLRKAALAGVSQAMRAARAVEGLLS